MSLVYVCILLCSFSPLFLIAFAHVYIAIGYSNPPGASPVPYNVPPAQGMVSSQDPGYSTVNAGVEMPGVYSSGGVKASAPPVASSSSFFSFGRSDPSHTRW